MSTEKYYIGTDLKFLLNIEADGFDMDRDDYTIGLKCGGTCIEVPKSDIVTDSDGNHYLLVDTTQFPAGMLRVSVRAEVPDEDFPSGIRHEVAVLDLCKIER